MLNECKKSMNLVILQRPNTLNLWHLNAERERVCVCGVKSVKYAVYVRLWLASLTTITTAMAKQRQHIH